jgi:8-oxo-dGTP diphosphatase
MHSFLCDCKTSEVTLNEHIRYEWLGIDDLKKLDWAEADIPIVDKLVKNGE